MAFQSLLTMVTPVFDDGNAFIFQFQDFNNNTLTSGFIHRPFSASEAEMANPPITFSETSDLGSWLETLKYAIRNNRAVGISYDDTVVNNYVPQWPGAAPNPLNMLYSVTDVP
jgi:hypothetical protein